MTEPSTLVAALALQSHPEGGYFAETYRVREGGHWSLVGCTVAPGFDFADFVMPSRAELLAAFPAHASLVRSLTR